MNQSNKPFVLSSETRPYAMHKWIVKNESGQIYKRKKLLFDHHKINSDNRE